MGNRIVIHRDHTFEYDGNRYYISQGADRGDDIPFTVNRIMSDGKGDWIEVEDGFETFAEIREWVERARANGWPLETNEALERIEARQRELDSGSGGA